MRSLIKVVYNCINKLVELLDEFNGWFWWRAMTTVDRWEDFRTKNKKTICKLRGHPYDIVATALPGPVKTRCQNCREVLDEI